MTDIEKEDKRLQYDLRQCDPEKCQSNEINDNISIMVHKKKVKNHKVDLVKYVQQPAIAFRLSSSCRNKSQKQLAKHISMTDIFKRTKLYKQSTRSSEAIKNKSVFNSKLIVNRVSGYYLNDYLNLFSFPTQKKWKVYRCQLSAPEDSCCCSCNSDAMFEVMKGLYDCYKQKNCDNCDCILCSHLLGEERRLGEEKKSLTGISLKGKAPSEKEKILKDQAMKGLIASEKKISDKVRADLGLPPRPKTASMKEKYASAKGAGLLQPLESKSPAEKEKILQGLQDKSEKALIAKVKATSRAPSVTPSAKQRKAKAAGLHTPLEGKTPSQKEKIIKGLAMQGLPLPEGKTSSEIQLIDKVRADLGLPPDPKTPSMKEKYAKAASDGLLKPLEGKSAKEKEKLLQDLQDRGIPLPEGRTPSEKALIAKVKARSRAPSVTTSKKLRKAKAAGQLTPLEGKTPSQKEKIVKGLAMQGLPLPEGKTSSEIQIIDKVRADLGLPLEPKTPSMKEKYAKAASDGLLKPLEGKSAKEKEKMLQNLQDRGIPLPEGRTASEKALIAKVKATKTTGLLTPLEGKTPSQKENIVRRLAMQGLPIPEGKTASEKKLIDKVRADLGLPAEPKTPSMKEKYAKAANEGLLQPLEGKSPKEKENILQGLQDKGIPLPEGRTPSERALIAKVKAETRKSAIPPSAKLREAKAAGLLTPLEEKTPSQKEKIVKGLAMQGLPLPEEKTALEKKLIDKVRADLGLPPEPKTPSMKEKYAKAASDGLLKPLEGKSRKEKEQILQNLKDRGIPLPEGRTASEKALIAKVQARPRAPSLKPSVKLREAKTAGLLTPLEGKTPSQKENIVKGIAMRGLLLPERKTASEKKLIDKVRADLGLPPEPKTPSMKEKYAKAASDGLLKPLEGKSLKEKEQILQNLKDRGIPLPEGRTASEKALIAKVQARSRAPSLTPSGKLREAKAAGLLTPLEGKTPAQKEKIVKVLAMQGLPLPEGKTSSEIQLFDKVRADLGLPPEPKTPSMKEKYAKAASDGLLKPLEGKSAKEKEKILQNLQDRGIPLPEGRTASEKALIAKVQARPRAPSLTPSAKQREAKSAGLLTPLEGKTPSQKEKIVKSIAMRGLPLPEGKTASEKKLIDKVRADLGLPPEPKTPSMKEKYAKAASDGLLKPLEGKSPKEKEQILQNLKDRGIPLSEGRTASEKALIAKVQARSRAPSLTPSAKLREAKAAGLLTLLEGKTPAQKEKIVKGLAMQGLPLPEGKTSSEIQLIDKMRADLGLPPEPKTPSMKEKYAKAASDGLLKPLEGKSAKEKEKLLQDLQDRGIPLPEGRTASEKALVANVKAGKPAVLSITTEKLKKAKAAGILTPLERKTPEQKQKILQSLAELGLPLPEGKTASEKAMIKDFKAKFGIPDKTPSEKMRKAKKTGLLTPLEGKTHLQKEKILRGRAAAGLPLPVGRTPSERAIIQKIKEDTGYVSPTPSERLKRAKDAGLLTPLEGKTPSVKEKILRERVAAGVPIPEGTTPSEKETVRKVTAGEPPAVVQPSDKEQMLKRLYEAGQPLPEGKTPTEKALIAKVKAEAKRLSKVTSEKLLKAKEAGLLTPLTGKSPKEKDRILKGLIEQGLPLPESQTASEKKIAEKVRKEMGLPPEPKTLSEKEKMRKAEAAGIIKPLEGKTPSQKERIVRGMVAAGVPLPEGRTASEKSVIKKVKAEEKISAKAAAGLLTPLTGKTPSQKEKIVRARAEAGIPLPEGKTPSEKALIQKVRTELDMPPPAKTISEKEVVRKAKEEGLLTPIAGKSAIEKERILKGLADAGLPLPEGKTVSEKELIKKVRAASELPPEPTASEKRGKIKIKSKKIGISTSKRAKAIAGISEKLEDIIKTTTCDRGCGCDKKKIKFKHSYIKIRVTSPDISSLCDCPDECLPGVKAGAFIDNEGIKVTVGRADSVTSYTSQFSNHILETHKNIITPFHNNIFEKNYFKKSLYDASLKNPFDDDQLNSDLESSFTETSGSYNSYSNIATNKIESKKRNYVHENDTLEICNDKSDWFVDSSRNIKRLEDIFRRPSYTLHDCTDSYESIRIIKSESSLSLNTDSSDSIDVTSVISQYDSSYYALSSTHYLYNPISNGYVSDSTVEETEQFPNRIDYSEDEDSGDDKMMR